MSTKKDISRRKFLRVTGLAGSGIALTAIRAGYAEETPGPTMTTLAMPTGATSAVTSKAYVYLLPAGMAG
ncbi:MAG: hypothetical protein JWP00_2220 [Chloroflexi bacterium]|nr:hypothetical protein [Chloroflexota bacterium]